MQSKSVAWFVWIGELRQVKHAGDIQGSWKLAKLAAGLKALPGGLPVSALCPTRGAEWAVSTQ